jgi:hypothetical protein
MELLIGIVAWSVGASASLLAGVTLFHVLLTPVSPNRAVERAAPRVSLRRSFSPATA